MTLADTILDRLRDIPKHDEAFGALIGMSWFLPDIARDYSGKTIKLQPGVEVRMPEECRWYTEDAAGGVRINFTGELPTVTVRKGIIVASPDLEGVTIRIDSLAVYGTLHLKKLGIPADIDLTLKLR